MKIGITGASGFIGAALAKRLRDERHHVVGLDRDERGALGCDGFVRGDVTDPAAVGQFVSGLDRVYHTAAIVAEDGDWDRFRRVNVDAPVLVARAARAAGVRELVHFSSVMVYGFDFPEGVAEDGPLDGAGNPYCQTKIEAEAALRPLHDPGRFDVYLIRPGDVYGRGSVPWVLRPMEMMRRRQWIYVDSRRSIFNHVYIDNLLDGIDLVLARRAAGRPFNITDGRRTTVREFFTHYQKHLGIRYLPEVPGFMAEPLAGVASRVSRLVGRPAAVNRQAVRYMRRRAQYSINALKALGYSPRIELLDGMRQILG